MAELVPLHVQVGAVFVGRSRHDGQPLDDFETIPLEPHELHWIVRQDPNRGQTEIEQDLRADSVVPEVGLEPELLVRFDGVVSGILELIRLELVEQADAAALLVQVDDNTRAFARDHAHGGLELPAAVTAGGSEDVARQALGVHADEHVLFPRHLAVDERDVLRFIHVVAIANDPEFTERRR